jgi:arylsulfatase
MVGKWHLSLTREEPGHMRRLNNQQIADAFSDPATYPTARGFDAFYGIIWGVVNFYDPFSLVRGAEPVREVPKDYYITDALTDEAVKFVEGGKPDQPFFLYVAHTAPHWPLHAPEADVARYAQSYAGGWDAVRQARHKRMVELGILPADHPLPPRTTRGGSPADWSANPTKEWDARAMAVHAAMIDRMDQGVGRLVAALRERKQLDNTLILFLSDNGASPEAYPNAGFDRPSQTRDGRKIAYPPGKTVMPGPETTFFYMGPDWASVANTPFRYWKAEMYDGGICTPMIAHWPKGVTAKAGAISGRPGHVMDVMATCLDLAGAEYPKTFDGRAVTPMEGRSLLPALRGEQGGGHEMLAWEHYNARAIRRENMKLVARAGQPWELYDLSKDRAEARDLASARPELVRDLGDRWQAWADRTQVFPAPQPAGDKAKAKSAAKRAD